MRFTLLSALSCTGLALTAAAAGLATTEPPQRPPALVASRTTEPAPAGTERAAVRGYLRDLVGTGIPGAFAVIRDGRSGTAAAAGVADVTTKRPMSARFQHRIGSVTKMFVAVTALQLVGEERLSLDDPVGKYLPDLFTRPGRSPDDRGRKVTVGMLLGHTSGLGNYTDALSSNLPTVQWLRHTTIPPRTRIAVGMNMPQLFAPGSQYSYSNTNYAIASLLIERLTGHSLDTEIAARILRPLRLTDTYLPGTRVGFRGPHSRGYLVVAGTRYDFTDYNASIDRGVGDMISTAADLETFQRALVTGKLLRPEQQAAMFTMRDTGHGGQYGLGLDRMRIPCPSGADTAMYGHTGGVFSAVTFAFTTRGGERQLVIGLNQAEDQISDEQAEARNAAIVNLVTTAACGTPPTAGQSSPAPTHTVPDLTSAFHGGRDLGGLGGA